ncbi:hypothetical protein Bca4012_059640 [Brassica carinata]
MPPSFNPENMEYLVMSSVRLKKLWGGVKWLGKLWGMHLSGCESLVEIPDLSMAIDLRYLELKDCKSLVMLHSSIRNLCHLKRLNMEGCTMLEALPVDDINLVTLKELYLSGCSKLRNFPQISTSIIYLYLDDTAIEEIPFWIKNMSRLRKLTMRRCKNLKNISAEIFKLECDKADFSDCGGITTICDHYLPGPHSDVFDISSYISFRFPQVAPFKFYNCFSLDRDAQEIIIQSYPNMAVIPGGEVPMYFTHRACGSSLSILLSETSLSQESILLKTCIVAGPSRHYPARLKVRQSFRGQEEEIPCDVIVDTCTYEMDHLVFFILRLQIKRVDNPPSELNNNNVLLLEFYKSHYDGYYEGCSCGRSFGSHKQNSTLEEIKGCGARVMDISKTDFRESDEESNRSKKKLRFKPKTCEIKAHKGDRIKVHYRGKLTDGTVFDSSFERGDPFEFKLGSGQVIKGWDQGLLGACVGEKRKLKIPAKLGYGEQGSPPTIPGGATLIFDTELIAVNGKPTVGEEEDEDEDDTSGDDEL